MDTLKNSFSRYLILILTLLLIIPKVSDSQNDFKDPVNWSYKVTDIGNGIYDIKIMAIIDEGWHLYSQTIPPGGPLPTEFSFSPSNSYSLEGKTKESPKPDEKYEAVFEMTVKSWSLSANFTQKIKVNSKTDFNLTVNIDYMVCNEGSCIALFQSLEIPVPGFKNSENLPIPVDTLSVKDTTSTIEDTAAGTINSSHIIDTAFNNAYLKSGDIIGNVSDRSLLWIFFAGFLGGLIALLTPCVWPMIPLTVSFFIKKTNRKKGIKDALIYGISIIVIYVLMGLGVTLIFGADKLNDLSTNPWFNVFFFLLLVVFAAAFFGAFELSLPSKWVNAMDSRAERTGGLIGIFFMAFTLALVSFSCTGPIIGTLLVEAVSRGAMAPLIGMTGFAIALAIPFTVFAIFPSWLSSLPKSGGWLNTVKVVLGFLELAFALKFLSVADLASHWGILPRETFLTLWIVIFAMLGFYLLGKIKFPHDSSLPHVSFPRVILAIITFAFAIYMIPGLWGAPLRAISAFSPPITTQDFNLSKNQVHAIFEDYDLAADYASKTKKPLIIDFTGWGCVNCRKMEVAVWTDPEIGNILKDQYVLVSLYVDDKTKLPEDEQYISSFAGKEKKIITVGNKWSDFQAKYFFNNSQPFYILLDNNGKMLNTPRYYNENIDEYKKWLIEGLEEYKKRIN